jgi:hypothetical protein
MTTEAKFSLGQVVVTPGTLSALEEACESSLGFLMRHAAGDWGDVATQDWQENAFSLDKSLRLLSAYYLRNGTKIWIITEADRSVTTILLPEEY